MAAPNADVMRGSGPSAVAPGSAIQQITHHQLPSNIPHQQQQQQQPQISIPPNHHIQQLQNLTQQTVTIAAQHDAPSSQNAVLHHPHRVQQHLPQHLVQQSAHPSMPHKIVQFGANIGNMMFPASENLSGKSTDTSASASDMSNATVVNIASVNQSLSIPTKDDVASLANSSNINPVLNRITTNVVGNIPPENLQVLQQPSDTLSPKGGSSVARSNVAPGWRRIKYNCEIIYISPSGAPLRNFNQVKEYLLSVGTCKCGLPCPFRPEAFFEFDSQVPNATLDFNSNISNNFCLHHTRYMEKVELVRRGKKNVESTKSDQHPTLPHVEVASLPSNDGRLSCDAIVSSNPGRQNPLVQRDKEIASIPLSKTPPWRKNASSASSGLPAPNSVTVVVNQRQLQSPSSAVPLRSPVQSINQNEQIVKSSRAISESPNPPSWCEGLRAPSEDGKIKTMTKKRPNFKDDPTGYLNQQTAILHSSISTLHSPDGSSSSQESPQLKNATSFDSEGGKGVSERAERGIIGSNVSPVDGLTVTHAANGMVQVQQNCDISHMKFQQQLQFQQQLHRQSQLIRQHHEQIQLLQQQQQQNIQNEDVPKVRSTASPCAITLMASRTPDVTSTSSITPDPKDPVQGGNISTSNRSTLFQTSLGGARSESPEIYTLRNLSQVSSGGGVNVSKNQSIVNVGHSRNTPSLIQSETKSLAVAGSMNKVMKAGPSKELDNDKMTVQSNVSSNPSSLVQGFHQQSTQQGQLMTQPQQVLMTSSGQIIVMSAQPNKNSVVGNNSAQSSPASSIMTPQQGMLGGSNQQYMSIGANANNGGIMQNIAHHQQQQQQTQNIIHSAQSNANSNFLINSPNNMQSTVILNNGNVIQQTGQQILTSSNNTQVIHSGNVLASPTTGTNLTSKVISNAGNGGLIPNHLLNSNNNGTSTMQPNAGSVISQQTGATMVLNSLPPNSIVIQPNYSSVADGGQIVNQVVNQDGTTTSFVQHQNPQQRHIMMSPDSKRRAKKRKSSGSTSSSISPGSIAAHQAQSVQITTTHAPQQHQQPATIQHQTIQPINQAGPMLQLAPQYSTQSFQLSSGLSGLTLVPNKNQQQPQQQQQILLQNGQIITQPYNIISQQVLLPAGLVMTPDATLVQIQNVATPCGSIITTPQGMVIRAQSPHQQKSFISPHTGQQFLVNNNGQVSPMGTQIYGGPVNIVVPQQQAGPTANSFVPQNATIVQQQPIVHQSLQVQAAAGLNTSTDSSSTASESPSLPTTPQPPVHQSQKSHLSYLSGAASPPDTTTHSPNSPDCASSEKSASSADSLNMAMVQCVSSSEPDLVLPTVVEGAQSPSDSQEYFEHGGSSYQRNVSKPSESKIRRMQPSSHLQSSSFVRNTVSEGSSTTGSNNGNSNITSNISTSLSHHHQIHIASQQQSRHQNHHSAAIMRQRNSPVQSVLPDSHDTPSPLSVQENKAPCPSPVVSPGATHSSANVATSRSFSIGELVWGAVRGFPAWPGKVIDSPDEGRTIPVDCVWVRWFGGRPNAEMVAVNGLKSLSEGLEAHHRAHKDARKGRKLNSQLERAIQEAMMELDRASGTPSPAPYGASSTSPAIVTSKSITIKASPTSSTSSNSTSFVQSSNINSAISPVSSGRVTKGPRGVKSKLVKIAPAPPSNVDSSPSSSGINSAGSATSVVGRIKMK